jgi:aminopeptidase
LQPIRLTPYSISTVLSALRQKLAARLPDFMVGEVGLVPHSSPISQSNLLFHSALFDENAASEKLV